MQDDPSAARLLGAIAESLEQQVLPSTDAGAQHVVRVAANLCRIVARELELEPAADDRARVALSELVGREASTKELWRELAERLTPSSPTEDPAATEALARKAHPVALAIVRDKLAVAKPGYDDYDFTGERR